MEHVWFPNQCFMLGFTLLFVSRLGWIKAGELCANSRHLSARFLRSNSAQKAIVFDSSIMSCWESIQFSWTDHKHLTKPQIPLLGIDGWTLTPQQAYHLLKANTFCFLPLFSGLRDFFDVEKQGATGDILDQSSTQIWFISLLILLIKRQCEIWCSNGDIYKDRVSCNNSIAILVSFWVVPHSIPIFGS